MRGKPTLLALLVLVFGLIPAYAGKTPFPAQNTSPWRAHPRVCGENLMDGAIRSGKTGSSPRMRGKLAEMLTISASARLIPAYAGKTVCPHPAQLSAGAHPRVCGENSFAL